MWELHLLLLVNEKDPITLLKHWPYYTHSNLDVMSIIPWAKTCRCGHISQSVGEIPSVGCHFVAQELLRQPPIECLNIRGGKLFISDILKKRKLFKSNYFKDICSIGRIYIKADKMLYLAKSGRVDKFSLLRVWEFSYDCLLRSIH